MTDLRRALEREARRYPPVSSELQARAIRRAERRHRNRRMRAAVLALVIAGVGSVAAYLGIPSGGRTPAANGPTPRLFGEKTVTVDGVPFTVSGSSSPDGPCIGVSAPGGSVGGGCGRSGGPFQWGLGGLRVNSRLYNIAYGEAPPDASRMEIVLGDGSTMTADTAEGLWLFVVPAAKRDAASDFTMVKAEDDAGNVLAKVDLPSLAEFRRAAQRQARAAGSSEQAPVHFAYGRLPMSSAVCPGGQLESAGGVENRIRSVAQELLRAANGASPDPGRVWALADDSLRALFGSYDVLAARFERAHLDPEWTVWDIHAVHPPDMPFDALGWVRQNCGQQMAAALTDAVWQVDVFWPDAEGLSAGVAHLYFVGRADGPRLWLVY